MHPIEVCGKAVYAVVSAGAETGGPERAIEAVKRRMTAYRANFIGSAEFVSHIFPCFKCGHGLQCKVGGFYRVYGEEGQKNLKITSALFKRWEDSPGMMASIDELAHRFTSSLESRR